MIDWLQGFFIGMLVSAVLIGLGVALASVFDKKHPPANGGKA